MTEEELKPEEGEEHENERQAGEETVEVMELDPSVQLEILENELKIYQDKADEYLDGWQRARAEFANYKKRVEREQAQAYQNASANIIKRYLDVLDDLDRALKNRPAEGEGAAWAEGVELIYRKFYSILEAEGCLADAGGKPVLRPQPARGHLAGRERPV